MRRAAAARVMLVVASFFQSISDWAGWWCLDRRGGQVEAAFSWRCSDESIAVALGDRELGEDCEDFSRYTDPPHLTIMDQPSCNQLTSR